MKTSTIGLRISDIEKEKLEELAKKRDVPISQIVREALRAYFKDLNI